MKKLIVLVFAMVFLLPIFSYAEVENCDLCKGFYLDNSGHLKSELCEKSEPAGDGCNSCTHSYYCVRDKEGNEHWYDTGVSHCTLVFCGNLEREVENPFK